jgi:putative hydrolase of the HAD superfamily
MKIIFLDCDQTLYRNNELMTAIRERMVQYMVKVLGKPVEEMVELRKSYLKSYGTTLAGLMRHQKIDPYDYMRFVHEVDVTGYINEDKKLRQTLLSLGVPIYILSNAPRDHVEKVLGILGISDIPIKIFTIEDFDFEGKPNRRCFEKVCSELGTTADSCWLVDDDAQNLEGAREFGMKTCLIDGQDGDGCDLEISTIYELANYRNLFLE